MARVFLSYDHRDASRAKSIAALLESAGHSVWWDREIKGGAQFGQEIERQLEQSDAVVVLWSERANQSGWVRDEATVGRDSGRLVPLLLDGASPPLGFRQYHSIDWSKSNGHRDCAQFKQLLASIDSLSSEKPPPRFDVGRPERRKLAVPRWSVAVIVLLLTVAAAAIWLGRREDPTVRTVVIKPADASPASEAVARELLVKLTTLQSADAGLVSLRGADAPNARADLIFEVGAGRDADHRDQTLALLDGQDRTILWSRDFDDGAGRPADIKLQVAYTTARVLDCALEALPPGERPLDQPTLKLYLTGCARLAESFGSGSRSLLPVFSEVVRRSPKFRAGWAKLLLAEGSVVGQETPDQGLDGAIQGDLDQARKLYPNLAEATLLEANKLPLSAYEKALQLADRAKQQDPDNAAVLSYRADQLRTVGRMRESIEDAKRAAALDPLSPSARGSYLIALAYGGRIDAARKELDELEKLWPGTGILQEMQFRFHLRYGDPERALRMARTLNIGGQNQELFLAARARPTPENIDRMIRGARRDVEGSPEYLGFLVQALGEFGRTEQLIHLLNSWPHKDEVRSLGDVYFRPALNGLRDDPRFMRIAAEVGLVSYWSRSGHWPDFCLEPDLPYDCKSTARRL